VARSREQRPGDLLTFGSPPKPIPTCRSGVVARATWRTTICAVCHALGLQSCPPRPVEPDVEHREQLETEADIERLLRLARRAVPRRIEPATELLLRFELLPDRLGANRRLDDGRN
jgi:hypothetical protein